MAPYTHWVHDSFKKVLLVSCDAFLESNDQGPEKTRSKLIKMVSEEITEISEWTHEPLLDDLEKVSNIFDMFSQVNNNEYMQCVQTWFRNYAIAQSKEERPGKAKSDTRGHPTSSQTWTVKSVCSHLYVDKISNEQKCLSGNGEKDIGKYCPALTSIFESLTD
jgi:hypothetical protein